MKLKWGRAMYFINAAIVSVDGAGTEDLDRMIGKLQVHHPKPQGGCLREEAT